MSTTVTPNVARVLTISLTITDSADPGVQQLVNIHPAMALVFKRAAELADMPIGDYIVAKLNQCADEYSMVRTIDAWQSGASVARAFPDLTDGATVPTDYLARD